jgi:O-antigen/teichoic acid export membrane protein
VSTQAASVGVSNVPGRERRPALAGAWVVSLAMLGSGGLIYAFHVLAARSLGPSAYGHIAVLWAAMFLVVIVLFRPLEQTTSRALADRLARGEDGTTVVRSIGTLAAAVVLVLSACGLLLIGPLADLLFEGNRTLAYLLLAGIAGYAVAYVSRGVLVGVRWFRGYGFGLMADAVARLAIAVPLLFAASLNLAAAAVTVAGIAGALAPLALGRTRVRQALRGKPSPRFRRTAAFAFAAPASAIAAADQLLVNGGPLLVVFGGGSAKTAGLVFAATMLVRVPVFVFQGLASSLLPNLARLNVVEDAAAFRRAVMQTALILLAAGSLIVGFAAVAGPESMELLYGGDFAVGRIQLVLLGTGVAFYLAATTFSQALLALERAGSAACAWVAAAALFTAIYFVMPGTELTRVSIGFAVAMLLDLAVLAWLLVRRTRP